MHGVLHTVCYVMCVLLVVIRVETGHAQTAAPYASALQRAGYQVALADLNGDGREDVLLLAKRLIVMLPLDDDLFIPLESSPPSPTFILWSQSDGSYTLDSLPAPSTIAHPAWCLTADYALVFGDILGNGRGAMLIHARIPGRTSFVVVSAAADGKPLLTQSLTLASLGIDLGGSRTAVRLTDTNGDGRADLQVLVDGVVRAVFIADRRGQLVSEDADSNVRTQAVGTLPGTFGVSPQGAATYAIPLQVPPGRGGLTPALTLTYNSQGGYGPLGMGWSLGGFSAITRCPPVAFLDGQRGAVRLTDTDRFCLDGQRLVAVQGTYGAHGTEYRTLIEGYSRVVSYGGSPATGPDSFKVWTKSGLIMEYGTGPAGDPTNGRIPAQGTQVTLVWAQSVVTDTQGNFYTIAYNRYPDARGAFSGEYHVQSIVYTANGSTPATHEVLFQYSETPNKNLAYVMGSAIPLTKRLTAIVVKEIGDPSTTGLLSYGLYYTASDAGTAPPHNGNDRDRLVAVNLCKAEGTGTGTLRAQFNDAQLTTRNCLPLTHFTWQVPTQGENVNTFVDQGAWGGLNATSIVFQSTGDFNGDGRADILRWTNTYQLQVCLALPSRHGFDCRVWAGPLPGDSGVDVQLGDFNGDGRTDMAVAWVPPPGVNCGDGGDSGNGPCPTLPPTANWQVCLSDGVSAFVCKGPTDGTWPGPGVSTAGNAWPYYTVDASRTLQPGDFNGDGLTDLLFVHEGHSTLYLSTGFGFVAQPQPHIAPILARAADIDGDGFTDILVENTSGRSVCRSVPNGKTADADGLPSGSTPLVKMHGSIPLVEMLCTATSSPASGQTSRLVLGDFNGDGRTDLASYIDNGVWDIRLSKGDGTFTASYAATGVGPRPGHQHVMAVDVNGDGLTDLVNYYDNGYWSVCLAPSDEMRPTWDCTLWPGGGGEAVFGDFNGDGRADMATSNGKDQGFHVWTSGRITSDVIERFTNGLGVETHVTYAPLTDPTVYTRDAIAAFYQDATTISNPAYPTREVSMPLLVVKQVDATNGIDGFSSSTYTYAGFKVDLAGRGSLGFREMVVTDQVTGIRITTAYHQDWPLIGQAAESTTGRDRLLKHETYTYATLGTHSATTPVFPYLARSEVTSYEYSSGSQVAHVTTMATYDQDGSATACSYTGNNCGNPTQIMVTTTQGAQTWTKTTMNRYQDRIAATPSGFTDWLLGRLASSRVTASAPGAAPQTRTVSFTYTDTGLLAQESIEPDHPDLSLITEYTYDRYGNKTTVTQSSRDTGSHVMTLRTTTYTYDAHGRCQESIINPLGHTERYTYTDTRSGAYTTRAHVAWCQPRALTGPNQLITTFVYDWLGRTVEEWRADGTTTQREHVFCDKSVHSVLHCPSTARHATVTTVTGAGPSIVYYDALNREVRTQRVGFNEQLVFTDTTYNDLGKVTTMTRPYFLATESPGLITTKYDVIGRVMQTRTPEANGVFAVDEIIYNGFDTLYKNALNQTRTETRNAIGKLVAVKDHANQVMTYHYDAFENLTVTTDPAGNQTILTYDLRGRKVQMRDPNMGTWSYVYDGLGLLRQQTDANQQTTSMTYDLLNRLLTKDEPSMHSLWTYDTCLASNREGKCLGQLVHVASSTGFQREVAYDALGRVAATTTMIDAVPYTLRTTYDSVGRVATVIYPNGYGYQNVYAPAGYLMAVRQHGAAGPIPDQGILWALAQADAQGRALRETDFAGVGTRTVYDPISQRLSQLLVGKNFGVEIQDHAYQWDRLGRLSTRTDSTNGLTERYDYDELNRLTGVTRAGSQPGTDRVTYDALGNVTAKSGVGTYTYNPSGTGSVRPHAVTSLIGSVYGIDNPHFSYDANGNLTGGLGRNISYTSFNLPSRITQGSLVVDFAYDSDYNRIKQIAGNVTTIYLNPRIDLGGTYTREVRSGTITHRWVVYAAGRAVMEMQRLDTAGTQTWQPRWYHTNHQGSLIALTDETGAVQERLSYDAWGQRRHLNGAADPDAPPNGIESTQTPRGYTLHEHLDNLGLVHMNGRVYDPVLGRMMQADPVIQAPGDLQSYNRYSYGFNNPLTHTDPSGYASMWVKWRKPILTAVAAIATYGATSWAMTAYATAAEASTSFATFVATDVVNGAVLTTAGKVAAASIAGFASGGIMGGTIESALQGAATAGFLATVNVTIADWSVPAKVGVKAMSSAAMAYVQGNDWRKALRFAALSEIGREAWEAAREDTDRLYAASCSRAKNCEADEMGPRTDGGRNLVKRFTPDEKGHLPGPLRWFIGTGMSMEFEQHAYDQGQGLCSLTGDAICAAVRSFVRQVSKPHDWGNSWSYDRDPTSPTYGYRIEGGGFSSFGGKIMYELTVQASSFLTMPPMAMYTAVSLYGYLYNPNVYSVRQHR